MRADEWRWIGRHLPPGGRVLDIGCGNGALLRELSSRIASGAGVDRSPRMISLARAQAVGQEHLSFETVDGPRLPFADASFDAVVSLLSFRYLDWDPIVNEIRRVLAPGGRILIVDMVTVPTGLRELPRFARSKVRSVWGQASRPSFRRALDQPVDAMLAWVSRHWRRAGAAGPDRFLTTGDPAAMRRAAAAAFGVHLDRVRRIPVSIRAA